jgi:hypothetical protein
VECVAGARCRGRNIARFSRAGFSDITIAAWRLYKVDEATEFLTTAGLDVEAIAPQTDGQNFAGAFICARKAKA